MDFDIVAFADRYGWVLLDIVVLTLIVPVLWVRTWIMGRTLREHLTDCAKSVDTAAQKRQEIYARITNVDQRCARVEGMLEVALKRRAEE